MNRRIVIETFFAKDNEGKRYKISVSARRREIPIMGQPTQYLDEDTLYSTSSGQPVNEEGGQLRLAADGRLLIRE